MYISVKVVRLWDVSEAENYGLRSLLFLLEWFHKTGFCQDTQQRRTEEKLGYTHHWTALGHIGVERFPRIVEDVRKIIEVARNRGVEIGDGMRDGGEPEITNEVIRLNGIGDDAHETFYLGNEEGFAFCKTAYKPYDVVVTAILALAHHREVVSNVSSDGRARDWTSGVALASEVAGEMIPNPIADDDE